MMVLQLYIYMFIVFLNFIICILLVLTTGNDLNSLENIILNVFIFLIMVGASMWYKEMCFNYQNTKLDHRYKAKYAVFLLMFDNFIFAFV